jgi:hypothetical protein
LLYCGIQLDHAPGVEYDGKEYGALPVDYSVFLITLCCNIFQLRTARR